jgi:predicted RNase H-like HicB family nuclease
MNPKIKELLLTVVNMEGEDGRLLPSLHTPEQIEKFARVVIEAAVAEILVLSQFDGSDAFGDGYENALEDAIGTIEEMFEG